MSGWSSLSVSESTLPSGANGRAIALLCAMLVNTMPPKLIRAARRGRSPETTDLLASDALHGFLIIGWLQCTTLFCNVNIVTVMRFVDGGNQ